MAATIYRCERCELPYEFLTLARLCEIADDLQKVQSVRIPELCDRNLPADLQVPPLWDGELPQRGL